MLTHQCEVQKSFGSKIVRVSEESRKLPVALKFNGVLATTEGSTISTRVASPCRKVSTRLP